MFPEWFYDTRFLVMVFVVTQMCANAFLAFRIRRMERFIAFQAQKLASATNIVQGRWN